jgi:hypothetical protein
VKSPLPPPTGLVNDYAKVFEPAYVYKELGDQSVDLYKRGRYVEGIEKYVQAIIKRLESTKSTVFSAYPTRLVRRATG